MPCDMGKLQSRACTGRCRAKLSEAHVRQDAGPHLLPLRRLSESRQLHPRCRVAPSSCDAYESAAQGSPARRKTGSSIGAGGGGAFSQPLNQRPIEQGASVRRGTRHAPACAQMCCVAGVARTVRYETDMHGRAACRPKARWRDARSRFHPSRRQFKRADIRRSPPRSRPGSWPQRPVLISPTVGRYDGLPCVLSYSPEQRSGWTLGRRPRAAAQVSTRGAVRL